MMYRLFAYSMVLLGISGTIYMAIEGVYSDEYDIPSYSHAELDRMLEASTEITIVDVRNGEELSDLDSLWDEVIHIPLYLLEKRSLELTTVEDHPIVLICPNGKRSMQGAKILRLAGFNAYYLEDGLAGS